MTRLDKLPERSRSKVARHSAAAPLWRRWQWLAALAAVGLAVLGVIAYVAGDRNGSTAANSEGAASSVGSVASASPGAAAITVHHHALRITPEKVVASLHVPSQLADALKKWDAGRGGTALAGVSGDLGDAMQASGVRLFGPMLQACSSLAAAVTAAKVGPPIPNAVMQASYSRALAKLATAAVDCQAGISRYQTQDEGLQTRENPAIIHQAESELAAGARDLYQATVDIDAIHGRANT